MDVCCLTFCKVVFGFGSLGRRAQVQQLRRGWQVLRHVATSPINCQRKNILVSQQLLMHCHWFCELRHLHPFVHQRSQCSFKSFYCKSHGQFSSFGWGHLELCCEETKAAATGTTAAPLDLSHAGVPRLMVCFKGQIGESFWKTFWYQPVDSLIWFDFHNGRTVFWPLHHIDFWGK